MAREIWDCIYPCIEGPAFNLESKTDCEARGIYCIFVLTWPQDDACCKMPCANACA